jgi:hypothetical protein
LNTLFGVWPNVSAWPFRLPTDGRQTVALLAVTAGLRAIRKLGQRPPSTNENDIFDNPFIGGGPAPDTRIGQEPAAAVWAAVTPASDREAPVPLAALTTAVEPDGRPH